MSSGSRSKAEQSYYYKPYFKVFIVLGIFNK